jgi:PAS domain S-box-containing protein
MADITKIDDFVQSSPHPAWLATGRGECLYVNPALEHLTGLKSDQINQVDWRSFVLEEDRVAASASWQRSLASGPPYRATVRLRGFDGLPATVELIAFGHTLNDGTEAWLFTGLHVHAATPQYPRLEAQLQATLNVIPAYTWYALPSGALTFVNERTGDYLGLPKDHPLRFGIDTGAEWDAHIPLLHPDDRETSRSIWSACVRTGSPSESNIRVRNAEGGYRWFLTQVEPLRASDGTLLYWIGVNIDIDEQKLAEEQLVKSAQELQRSEFYLTEAQRLGHIGNWVFDPAKGFEYWSEELFRIYDLEPGKGPPNSEQYLAAVHPQDREFMVSLMKRMVSDESGFDVTKRIVRASGEVRYVRCVGTVDSDNDPSKRIGVGIDVTDHEILTQELRRREAYLAEAQRLSRTGSFGWKPDTGEIVWSDETYRIFEYDSTLKPTLDSVAQRVHPDDRALVQQVIDRASQTCTDFEHEYRLLLADGQVKHVHAIAHASQDASGNREFIGAVSDITERKTAEEALRSSQDYLLEAQRLTLTGSWAWSPVSGDIRYWSEECYRVLGFDPAESPPPFETFFERIHPHDQAATRERFEKAIRDKADFQMDYRIVHSDGETRNIHVVGHPTLGPSGDLGEFVGTVIDVTDRLHAEGRIRRNEKELRTLIEAIPAYVGTNLPDGSVDFMSQSWLDYTGFSGEQGMGWGWASAIHPEDLDRVVANWRAAVAAGAPVEHELRCRRADGTYHWFLYRGLPLHDDGGDVVKWYGTLTNIDALKEVEQALQLRQHELVGIIETIPSMLWSTSPTGEPTHLSQRMLEYFGTHSEELVNRGWLSFVHPDDREGTAKAFRAIGSGESYNVINRLRRADGEYRWHQTRGEPLRDRHGTIIQWYGLSVDIDERKRAEDHLRDTRIKLAKASRLATVAELAGSIAHELNQPLMSILANAQAAKRWLNAAPSNVKEAASSIERIIRDARAADETMQHIRALFKQESFDKKDVSIPDLLHEVVRFVQEDPKKRDIPVEYHFEESLPVVHVDQIQIQQVFVNLIVNAIEALERQQVAPLVVLRATTDSNGMLVQVIDNGPGVDDPDRIFDAFMTTKEKGMGIGLAMSHTIIEAHGGRLWAENNRTGGATFNVALPLTDTSRITLQTQECA